MKVALVHDYLREFGGAERVLKVLTEIYPKAPIYTAFRVKNSTADNEFKGKNIIESAFAPILKIDNLYSPLRFLSPAIWKSFDLSKYDLVITSSSWYITRGFRTSPGAKVVCYCHTPPRWLYGYETSIGLTKYWPVRMYAAIIGHFMRMYDFNSAQKIKYWIANSRNVQERIEKFYRKNSKVIYPPVNVEKIIEKTRKCKKKDYFLIVSRLVGAKGIEHAVSAFKSKPLSGYKLKIVGETQGYSRLESEIKNNKTDNVELLGRVSDEVLWKLYAQARGFIALARDEDFGMTPVESQAAGTPVIAFSGGGFKETVIDGVTGILINDTKKETISNAIIKSNKRKWDVRKLRENAQRFSKEKFVNEVKNFIKGI